MGSFFEKPFGQPREPFFGSVEREVLALNVAGPKENLDRKGRLLHPCLPILRSASVATARLLTARFGYL